MATLHNIRFASHTWIVCAGSLSLAYFTEYHAEQMARALRLNGLVVTITHD